VLLVRNSNVVLSLKAVSERAESPLLANILFTTSLYGQLPDAGINRRTAEWATCANKMPATIDK
jgi:hypothetical protein